MKKSILLFIGILFTLGIQAQSFIGSWERYHTDEANTKLKSVVIFADGYQVITTYDAKSGAFISTNGGTWKLDGNTMTEKIEFDSRNPERVGTKVSFQIKIQDTSMEIVGSDKKFTRIDNGMPGKLKGAWLMSGRKREGKLQSRDTSRPRKTMKILSGTRFQWIAYNTETKQFMGTGGGTYITADGTYTEHIEFFSKDTSRVGARLKFNYEIIDEAWHHSGLSSKGKPIYEIWSIRK